MENKITCYYNIENGFGLLDYADKEFLCTYKNECMSKIRAGFQNKCLYELLRNGNGLNRKVKSKLERIGRK